MRQDREAPHGDGKPAQLIMAVSNETDDTRWYRSAAPGDLTPAQLELYRAITEGPRASQAGIAPMTDAQGRLIGPFAVMLLAPELGQAVQGVGAALRFHGALDPFTRELLILTVANHRSCDFEWFSHEPLVRRAGLSGEQLTALRHEEEPLGLPAITTVAWRTAQALLLHDTLDESEYGSAVEALGEAGLAEVVWLTGYYSMLATALAAFAAAS